VNFRPIERTQWALPVRPPVPRRHGCPGSRATARPSPRPRRLRSRPARGARIPDQRARPCRADRSGDALGRILHDPDRGFQVGFASLPGCTIPRHESSGRAQSGFLRGESSRVGSLLLVNAVIVRSGRSRCATQVLHPRRDREHDRDAADEQRGCRVGPVPGKPPCGRRSRQRNACLHCSDAGEVAIAMECSAGTSSARASRRRHTSGCAQPRSLRFGQSTVRCDCASSAAGVARSISARIR
jgi:hypothetical protein